jgi:hypothetical protein
MQQEKVCILCLCQAHSGLSRSFLYIQIESNGVDAVRLISLHRPDVRILLTFPPLARLRVLRVPL